MYVLRDNYTRDTIENVCMISLNRIASTENRPESGHMKTSSLLILSLNIKSGGIKTGKGVFQGVKKLDAGLKKWRHGRKGTV